MEIEIEREEEWKWENDSATTSGIFDARKCSTSVGSPLNISGGCVSFQRSSWSYVAHFSHPVVFDIQFFYLYLFLLFSYY